MNPQDLMLFDALSYPVVHVKSIPQDLEMVERWILEIEVLMSKSQAFVLVYPPMPLPPEEEDINARKHMVLWLKEHRPRFSALCRAMILTATEQPENLAQLKQMAPVLAAVYGVNVLVEPNALAAEDTALSVLIKNNEGAIW